jgi:WD40 repeat protein
MIPLWDIAISPDGASLASCFGDSTVWIWRVADGTLQHILREDTTGIGSVAFSPDGTILASGSTVDGILLLWQVEDGKLLHRWESLSGLVHSVTFSPDGTILASVVATTIQLRRVPDGKLLSIQTGHTDWVSSIAFSPDGTILASGAEDGTIWLWQVQP